MTTGEVKGMDWQMPQTVGGWVALVLRVCMGAWFVYAGGIKVFGSGLEKFVMDIENYGLVDGWQVVAVAYFMPWLEIVAGLCFMSGFLCRGAWWAMLGMVIAFSYAVGSAWSRGLDITCGCTGGAEKISYWGKAVEFAGYNLILGWIAWVEWRKPPVANLEES